MPLLEAYFTVPDEVFHEQACRYVKKDSSQLEFVATLTAGFTTDGYNSWLNHRFFPSPQSNEIETALAKVFDANVGSFMSDWGRSGFELPDKAAPSVAPITFVRNDKRFTYYPQGLPPPWRPESMGDG